MSNPDGQDEEVEKKAPVGGGFEGEDSEMGELVVDPLEEALGGGSDEEWEVLGGAKAVSWKAIMEGPVEIVLPEDLYGFVAEGDRLTYDEHLKNLERFFEERALSHRAARESLEALVPSMMGRISSNEMIDKRVNPHYLYSSTRDVAPADWKRGDAIAEMRRKIQGEYVRKAEPFMKNASFVHASASGSESPIDTAMRFPRNLAADEELSVLGVEERDKNPEGGLLYQQIFLDSVHRAFDEDDGHRRTSMAAQLAAFMAKVYGVKRAVHPAGKEFPVLSVEVFKEISKDDSGKQYIRQYVDSVLSLIMPDKDKGESILKDGKCRRFVQEDFITVDLMALVMEFGLMPEYKEVFDALFRVRQMAYIKNMHLRKRDSLPEGHPDRGRMSLRDLIDRFESKHGRKPVVASIGYGDGVLEEMLARKGLVKAVHAVDLNEGSQKTIRRNNIIQTAKGEKVLYTRVRVPEEPDIEGNRRVDRVFRCLPDTADIVVMNDCLHEITDDAGAVPYIRKAVQMLNVGGMAYIVDPGRCGVMDNVTEVTLIHFDSTRKEGAMLTWEQMANIAFYLGLKGVPQLNRSVVPGLYGGYVDAFTRFSLGFEKNEVVDFSMPEEDVDWKKILVSDDQIFDVWPLSLVPEEKREDLLQVLHSVIGRDVVDINMDGKGGVSYADVKFSVLKWLLRANQDEETLDNEGSHLDVENARANAAVRRVSPFRKFLDPLIARVGEDPDLRKQDRYTGEVIALVAVLKSLYEIDIEETVREQAGWEYFELKKAA